MTNPEKPEKLLSLLFLYVPSLKKLLENLEALVFSLESPPLILCPTEIWLPKNDNDRNCVARYTEFEASNRSNCSGGAMIQVRENSNIIQTYESPFEEIVLIDTFGFRFRLLYIFNLPKNNKIDFVYSFDQFLAKITSEKIPNIICGDINIDVIPNIFLKSNYLNAIEANGFKMISNEATRISHVS